VDQLTVINAGQPARTETSRKAQLKVAAQLHLLVRRDRSAFSRELIEPLAIGVRHRGDVGGVLQPPFNLEAGDPRIHQIRQQLPGGQILRRQQITLFAEVELLAIHDQFVGEAAGLGTFAAIGAPLAQGFAGQALAGVGHTEGAMDEHLQRHLDLALAQLLLDAPQVLQAQLTGEDHPLAAELLSHRDTSRTGDGHLRRAMDGQLWRERLGQGRETDVLNDQGINTGGIGGQEQLCGTAELVGEDEDIERQETFQAAAVQPSHHLREIGDLEVLGP